MEGVCENCAAEDEDLTSVWPMPEGSTDSPQLWCDNCRDGFPHEPVEDEEQEEEEG